MPMIFMILSLLLKYGPTVFSLAKQIWALIKAIRDEKEKSVAKAKFVNILKGKFVGGEMIGMLENLHADLTSAQNVAQRRKKK